MRISMVLREKDGALWRWSTSRPGVAMITSGFLRSMASCPLLSRPPEREREKGRETGRKERSGEGAQNYWYLWISCGVLPTLVESGRSQPSLGCLFLPPLRLDLPQLTRVTSAEMLNLITFLLKRNQIIQDRTLITLVQNVCQYALNTCPCTNTTH